MPLTELVIVGISARRAGKPLTGDGEKKKSSWNRRVTLTAHTGIFANLMISKQGESLVLDPHVTGEFLITFDEQGAKALRDILTK